MENKLAVPKTIKKGSMCNSSPSQLTSNKKLKGSVPGTKKLYLVDKRCKTCNTLKTSQWRKGPDGDVSLCNACGLRFQWILRKQRDRVSASSASGLVPIHSLLNEVPKVLAEAKQQPSCKRDD